MARVVSLELPSRGVATLWARLPFRSRRGALHRDLSGARIVDDRGRNLLAIAADIRAVAALGRAGLALDDRHDGRPRRARLRLRWAPVSDPTASIPHNAPIRPFLQVSAQPAPAQVRPLPGAQPLGSGALGADLQRPLRAPPLNCAAGGEDRGVMGRKNRKGRRTGQHPQRFYRPKREKAWDDDGGPRKRRHATPPGDDPRPPAATGVDPTRARIQALPRLAQWDQRQVGPAPPTCGRCAEWVSRPQLAASERGECLHPGSGFTFPPAAMVGCPFFR